MRILRHSLDFDIAFIEVKEEDLAPDVITILSENKRRYTLCVRRRGEEWESIQVLNQP